MQDTMVKVRALFKAQSALTRIELRAKATQAVYVSLAFVFGLLGLGMLNAGAFLALTPLVGAAWSAVILGVLDALLAALIAKAAANVTPGTAGETATELRDMVVDSLATEAAEVQAHFRTVQGDIQRIHSAVSSGISGISSVVPGVSSVVGLLMSSLKSKKKKKQ